MEIVSAGENALIVYLGHETSPDTAARVQAATQAIGMALGQDLVDVIPSYASVLVVYDLLRTDHLAVRKRIHAALDSLSYHAPGYLKFRICRFRKDCQSVGIVLRERQVV